MKRIKFMPVAATIIILIILVSGCSPTNNIDSDEALEDNTSARPTQNEVTDRPSTNTQDLIDATVMPSDIVLEDCFVCTIPEDEPYISESGKPFTKEDTYVADFSLGDKKEDVLSKVGTPQNTSEVLQEASGDIHEIYEFSFGQLIFSEDKLITIEITDSTYEGPRGIKVGMQMADVTPLFAYDIEVNNPYLTIFYRANHGYEKDYAVPPSAVLYKGDLQTLAYSVFTDNSMAGDMSEEELSDGGYLYVEQYTLVCEFDSSGLLLNFAVRVGALAE